MFHILDMMLFAVQFVFLRHFQFIRSDEMESRIKMTHGHQQRMYGTSILQVAHQIDIQVFQCTLRLIDGI